MQEISPLVASRGIYWKESSYRDIKLQTQKYISYYFDINFLTVFSTFFNKKLHIIQGRRPRTTKHELIFRFLFYSLIKKSV